MRLVKWSVSENANKYRFFIMILENEIFSHMKIFFKIYFEENKKGNYLPDKFKCFEEVKNIDEKISNLKKGLKNNKDKKVKKEISNCYRKKIEILNKLFCEIQNKIDNEKLNIHIDIKSIKDKDTYIIDTKNEALFFALKFAQKDIQRSFKVKQSDRNAIIEQIKCLIDDEIPKFIIRLDIKNFYETIPHDKLKKIIKENYILEPTSKKIIFTILKEYSKLSNNQNIGIPRGIGISAYLSELYMRNFDKKVNNLKEVVYYARYVDDIIIISTSNIGNKIKKLLKNETGLSFHDSTSQKRKIIDTSKNKQLHFDFLGYAFKKEKEKLSISLSKNKIKKYKNKITKTIECYNKQSKHDDTNARRMLRKRLKYLTGNIALKGVKKHIYTGVFYSNRHINNISCFQKLDNFLKNELKKIKPYEKLNIDLKNLQKLKNEIKEKYSFVKILKTKKFFV
ncbi:antiviral reverse transcriptase Drt3a [Campylobacter insulaenigrae]|uniref:antiviral reverse transcriptase Drt3a n=1 Tax=Campylobacter insulaenigrae TaxID=260714 RepID=UPI000F83FAD5|nr:antiviral reverse transcriptase Drt3a [Campylobacter insulaenigrae]